MSSKYSGSYSSPTVPSGPPNYNDVVPNPPGPNYQQPPVIQAPVQHVVFVQDTSNTLRQPYCATTYAIPTNAQKVFAKIVGVFFSVFFIVFFIVFIIMFSFGAFMIIREIIRSTFFDDHKWSPNTKTIDGMNYKFTG